MSMGCRTQRIDITKRILLLEAKRQIVAVQ